MTEPAPTCPSCGMQVDADARVCPNDGTALVVDAQDPTTRRDPLLGAKLGEYLVEERIGTGGMGIVYRGRQPVISKTVAIKILRPDLSANSVEVERILTEARTVNAIGHRGIIDIFGFGTVPDGRQYLVMEYLDGAPLDRIIAERAPLPIHEVLPILDELLDALGAVHAAGVVHRDLKPSNIFLVNQRAGSAYVKILDFGLAKQGLTGGEVRQTRQSMVCGTPEFMAPEQARGMPVSPRTDLYALGCIAYEMLTGQLPFVAPSPVELMMAHIERPVTPPSRVNGALPESLDPVLLRLLSKDPEQRPPNAGVVRTELRQIRHALSGQEAVFRVPQPLQSMPPRQALRPGPGTVAGEGHLETRPAQPQPANAPEKPPPPVDEAAFAPTYRVPSISSPAQHSTKLAVPPRRMTPWIAAAAAAVLVLGGAGVVMLNKGDGAPAAPPAPEKVVEKKAAPTPAPVAKAPEPEPAPAPAPAAAVTTKPEPQSPPQPEPKKRNGKLRLVIAGWGDVYIDGAKRGRVPPVHEYTVSAGEHRLEIRQFGSVLVKDTIEVEAGKTLEKRVEARPRG